MSLSREEIQKISPYQEVTPKSQACTFCGAQTSPKIVNKHVPNSNECIQEAHWVCGRCNNRFHIGRVRR